MLMITKISDSELDVIMNQPRAVFLLVILHTAKHYRRKNQVHKKKEAMIFSPMHKSCSH
jgi:hypothetical protein